tara:strand:- start:657 stop:770 length:114 start_codon:yes stop_codon:yes gene_type:complete
MKKGKLDIFLSLNKLGSAKKIATNTLANIKNILDLEK